MEEQSMFCTSCSRSPQQMCLSCSCYLCTHCVVKHHESCDQPDLHSVELVELARQGETGIARIRRGQTVDLAISHLRSLLERITDRALADVEAAGRAAHNCIDLAKEMLVTKVHEEVLKLSHIIDDLDSRLSIVKYSEVPEASLEIESLFLEQSLPTITARLEAERWIEIVRNNIVFSQLESNLASVQLSSALLCKKSACTWINRYALLMGRSTTMCDLSTLEIFEVPFKISWSDGAMSIQLSSGAYFLCGGVLAQCYLIDNNYSEMKEAGSLVLARLCPGLAARGDLIYVFGGLESWGGDGTHTIQVFNLSEQRAHTLDVEMVLERFSLSPCWCRERILLAGGRCGEGIEEFDPEQQSIRFIPLTIPRAGPTVCFPLKESQIVVLSCYQYVFNADADRLTAFSKEEEVFLSHFSPLLYQDKYYFTIYRSETEKYMLAFMSRDSLQLQFTGIEYR